MGRNYTLLSDILRSNTEMNGKKEYTTFQKERFQTPSTKIMWLLFEIT